ncbi:MAG TPA: glycosyltransferase family 2 protein, partial [Mucilaginibacter sp.]|nr:glycosyltransferase family 2 protein [Mucilaginibacter sp.]
MKVSVIIPCYNDGQYLKNAVASVVNIKSPGIELIIVNDGSSDPETLLLLDSYTAEGLKVLSHENRGLAYTRNRGIREAVGEYVLPLDADNIIKPGYIEKGIELLDSQPFDIVYAKPFFLGEDLPERKFEPHDFIGQDLFWGNYIDACAIYRKAVWEAIGGYDEKMPYQGYEDWEFWVNSYLSGYRFKYIEDELYGYTI